MALWSLTIEAQFYLLLPLLAPRPTDVTPSWPSR